MQRFSDNMLWEDEILLKLRSLYETYGYRPYRMGKFEPYDIYRENRNFLVSDMVITFTDRTGRLMALKPDVTMSIVKNTPKDTVRQKLYYNENVFRADSGSRDYKEIRQIGLDFIGCAGGYEEAETVLLAMKSLEIISSDYVLAVGHMGLTAALLESCGLSQPGFDTALNALRHKNSNDLNRLADAEGLNDKQKQLLTSLAGLPSAISAAAECLHSFDIGEEAKTALSELCELWEALKAVGRESRIRLDFSVINDRDYYNGIVFQGYIQGIPQAVLSGGRYDNLMRRFEKPQPAMGYAIYIGELINTFEKRREYDADILLVYDETTAAEVMQTVESLTEEGYAVLAASEPDPNIKVRAIRRMLQEDK